MNYTTLKYTMEKRITGGGTKKQIKIKANNKQIEQRVKFKRSDAASLTYCDADSDRDSVGSSSSSSGVVVGSVAYGVKRRKRERQTQTDGQTDKQTVRDSDSDGDSDARNLQSANKNNRGSS